MRPFSPYRSVEAAAEGSTPIGRNFTSGCARGCQEAGRTTARRVQQPLAMLKALSVVVMMSLLSGCVLRGEYRGVAYAVDGTMIAAGAALALADEPGGESSEVEIEEVVAWPLLAMNEVGVGMIAVGVIAGVLTYSINAGGGERPAAPAPTVAVSDDQVAPLPELRGANPDAVLMAQQARVAALSGRCDVVRRYADRVVELDERYYVRVFEVDPTLRACF